MRDPRAIADRFQIEALRGGFTDASMMREGRRPRAVGPVVAVADAGRITEVDFVLDFVLDRHQLARLSPQQGENASAGPSCGGRGSARWPGARPRRRRGRCDPSIIDPQEIVTKETKWRQS